jgi:4-hydroxybenzoate polyprenyltransferase
VLSGIRDYLELIKFEHTIFALPFAYLGMLLAAEGWPSGWQVLWITVAMAAARTVAMGVNRLADRVLDAHNPRTANRPLVTGRISPHTAWTGTIIAALLLAYAAWRLGPMPLRLLPIAMIFLIGYAFTKRFTWLSHYILGFTDGLAPVGAWVAVRGSLFSFSDLPAWLLLGAVTFWIGGFDLIYACQDVEVDRACGLHAIPARFGVRTALRLSAGSHLLTVGFLAAVGAATELTWPYAVGLVVVSALLIVEHLLVSSNDMSHLNTAFFNVNSLISVTLLIGAAVALMLSIH